MNSTPTGGPSRACVDVWAWVNGAGGYRSNSDINAIDINEPRKSFDLQLQLPANHTAEPSLVVAGERRFLISDSPNNERLPMYIQEFRRHNVRHVVRACEPTYDEGVLADAGMVVHDLPFSDGANPSDHLIKEFLTIVDDAVMNGYERDETIAVHCMGGLGRAPTLVAVALVEGGLLGFEAVDLVRSRRRGSLNHGQAQFVLDYVPLTRIPGGCVIA
eukprot:TRINITY_DN5357_c0_g1_i1.p1 TRINITY_DN5357_c0_g1~~TRINITY_DN5357_c0_g1_i1.p1  ORF type:complete len:217 (+),score=14.63 TRINITY_DN5357_c0_g1_i1:164-814(+)